MQMQYDIPPQKSQGTSANLSVFRAQVPASRGPRDVSEHVHHPTKHMLIGPSAL